MPSPVQNIPLGRVDRAQALRLRARRSLRRWVADRGHVLAAAVGLAAAGAGAFLASAEAEFEVSMSPQLYRVGAVRLVAQGGGGYEGPGGALVLVREERQTRAAASTNLNGVHTRGHCILVEGSAHESCHFVSRGGNLAATDSRTSYGWLRHYDDGRLVRIRFQGRAPVPVPFALGR